jgi:hypothetical protein
MMEAVHTSETSVNFNVTTWRYIPEDSKLRTRFRENLKSHKDKAFVSPHNHQSDRPFGAVLNFYLGKIRAQCLHWCALAFTSLSYQISLTLLVQRDGSWV